MVYWEEGKKLNGGKYIVEEILGSGGFGVNYKVIKTRTQEIFVIKTLNALARSKPNFGQLQDDFLNEAITLAACRHANIVRVYPKSFREDGLFCMVMAFIEGQNLAQYIEKTGKISENQAISLITKVGEALIHVHQQGLLHRDIKPSNIMLRNSDLLSPVLIDFGLAKEFDPEKSMSMDARLTDGFAPLEQYDLKSFQRDLRSLSEPINLDIDRYRAGTWTDVYALAATLYVLLTNNQPIPATWRKVSPESFTPPQKHNPNISDRTNAAILKGMEIEPENRSQSVAEWLDLLNSAQKKNTKVRAVKENIIRVFQFDMIKINNRGEIIKTEHNSAKYFSENLGNGITLDMVSIPGGSFMMGTANSEIEKLVKKYNSDWFRRESPQHEVTVTEFYIGKFQITQEQWKQVSKLPQVERELKKYPSHFPKAKLPVEKVSWYDAVEFCARLSKATGKEYRLPSEVEWEYACRARTATPFYFGETITGNLANYDASYTYANEVSAEYRGETTLVGSFLPNQFGLYEMHGNVWEWCADNYHENYDGAPSDSHAWISEYTTTRILRGGSWLNVSGYCRSANRTRNAPDILYNNCGFRCVMSH